MLHILLLILKIIGIILLIIIGIILFCLISVLFIPIKYQSNTSLIPSESEQFVEIEKLHSKNIISWFFKIFYLVILFEKSSLTIYLRILGLFKINLYPKREKKVPTQNKKKRKIPQSSSTKLEQVTKQAACDAPDPIIESSQEDFFDNTKFANDSMDFNASEKSKISFATKIKNKLIHIKYTIGSIYDKIKSINDKRKAFFDFITKEEVKHAGILIKDTLIKMLKHIMPRKIKGYVHLGFADPSTTGQLYGGYTVLRSIYGDSICFEPEFEKQYLSCDFKVKGHIRIIMVLYYVIKIILEPDIRFLIKRIKNKEEDYGNR